VPRPLGRCPFSTHLRFLTLFTLAVRFLSLILRDELVFSLPHRLDRIDDGRRGAEELLQIGGGDDRRDEGNHDQHAALGDKARIIIDIGVTIALFNAMLSLLMYFGRGVYTTGRDGVWPASVNRIIGSINRFRAPGAGVLLLAIPAGILVFTSALNFLIIFAGTVIAAVYFCIGLAALWSRRSMPDEPRPYKMPLWPLPPLVVIGFTGIALATQERQYLIAEVVLICLALAAWAGSKKWSAHPPEHHTPEPEIRNRSLT
jgi:amino acid transporter